MSINKDNLYDVIKKDLYFIISFHERYNITPASWYWRTQDETEDEWIQRRVKLCISMNEIQGYVKSKTSLVDYKISIDSSEAFLTVTTGLNSKKLSIPYNDLYSTIELLCKE